MFALFAMIFIMSNYKNKFIDDFSGKDNRIIITNDVTEIQIIENFYKMELLNKLISTSYHNEEKITMLNKMPIIITNIQINDDIKPVKLMNGGLMNDWNFEEF
jgi:hypothetical protein